MSPAVNIAFLATFIIGATTPFLKISQQAGINASELLFINGLSNMLVSVIGFLTFNYSTSGFNARGLSVAIPSTIILNVGFFLINYSFSLKSGLVSVMYAITPAASLITIIIGLKFLGESSSVILYRFLIGAAFIIFGTFLVTTSIKTN